MRTSFAVPIELRKGTNTFLVKAANIDGAWGFALSIVDERGMPALTWAE